MCIIVGEIEEVTGTNIAVVVKPEGRQLVVYSNNVQLTGADSAPVAMILPFPHWSGRAVEVVPTEASDCLIFEMLDRACTPYARMEHDTFGGGLLGYDDEDEDEAAPLEVLRADASVFTDLPADLAQLIAEYAAAQFGFIVCIIDAGTAYTPFAYLCDRLQCGAVFVPTKHYHMHGDGAAHGATADWDHSVYLSGVKTLKCESINMRATPARCGVDCLPHGPMFASALAKEFGQCDAHRLACFRIISGEGGDIPNEDMVVKVD